MDGRQYDTFLDSLQMIGELRRRHDAPITLGELTTFLQEQRGEEGEHAERTAKRMMEKFAGRRFV